MAKPQRPNTKADEEDLTRIDNFRTDEDSGGDAAPPLRPRDESTAPRDVRKPAKGPA
jgi:hypothetical protein